MTLREAAWRLLEKAAQDEALVDEVLESPRVSDEIVGFHLQQAAEKILKAMLTDLGRPFLRTHNLRLLMDLLADAGRPLPESLGDLDTLTPFGTFLRYEAALGEPALDRAAARGLIRSLRVQAERVLGPEP
jgi:HEPN domain-containing protein